MDGTFVEAIVGATRTPQVVDLAGKPRLVAPEDWKEIERKPDPSPTALVCASLASIAAYLDANRDKLELAELAVHVVDHAHVDLVSKLEGEFQQRHRYVRAEFESLFGGGFRFGAYLDYETFIIGLQSLFVQTKTRDDIAMLMAGITENQVKNTFDDGLAQSVTVAAGVALVGNVKVPNPVALQPFRTFREIEQPESLFVLRLQAGAEGQKPKAALFEADGGAWRLTAIDRIGAYLRERLKGVAVLA